MTDNTLRQRYSTNHTVIEVGVDEVGRGCLGGRVYAAAVVWPRIYVPESEKWVKDSKRLSEKKRNHAETFIKNHAIAYHVAWVSESDVDSKNILQASLYAMRLAIDGLSVIPDQILVDGTHFTPYLTKKLDFCSHLCVPKGDSCYYSIAAASILAKVARDSYIQELVTLHPILERYGWRKNKSYGTKQHIQAIREFGITPWHRKSFKPCCYYEVTDNMNLYNNKKDEDTTDSEDIIETV